MFKIVIIALFTLLSLNVYAGKDADGNEIIVSNQKMSIVKLEKGNYQWRAGGRSGTSSSESGARKAAKEAIKDSKDK